jgi:hypothetical protein
MRLEFTVSIVSTRLLKYYEHSFYNYIVGHGEIVFTWHFNPLNAELNPICHLLILLGDLTFMDPCIVSISNKMQRYTVYLYLETAYATHSTLKPVLTLPR